jgi:hypothetical protein
MSLAKLCAAAARTGIRAQDLVADVRQKHASDLTQCVRTPSSDARYREYLP